MIRAIVFDKDGTLLEYEAFWVPVAEAAVRVLIEARCDRPDAVDELYREMLTVIGAEDGIMGVLCHGTYGDIAEAMEPVRAMLLPHSKPMDAAEVAHAFEVSIDAGGLVPICADLPEVMADLKARGLILGLVTSDNRAITERCLSALGILPYFDSIRTDDGISPAKPAPFHMLAFCAEFGLTPEEVIMVGDTASDMRFAQNSGTRALGVAKSADDAARLAPLAETVLHDVSAIPAYLDGVV